MIDSAFKDRLFVQSTYHSREEFDNVFKYYNINNAMFRVFGKITNSVTAHEILMFLVTQYKTAHRISWSEILQSSDLKGGSVQLFTKMMECNMEYAAGDFERFEQLFLRVNFFQDVEGIWTNKCMDMLLSGPLLTIANHCSPEYEERRKKGIALMILKQTGRLDFMQRYIESAKGDFSHNLMRFPEIMRHFFSTEDVASTQDMCYRVYRYQQYQNFVKWCISQEDPRPVHPHLQKLELLSEALCFAHRLIPFGFLSEIFRVRAWIYTTIQECIIDYMDSGIQERPDEEIPIRVENVLKEIQERMPPIQRETEELININLSLKEEILKFQNRDKVERKKTYQIQENVKVVYSYDKLYIWKNVVPTEIMENLTTTKTKSVLQLDNARIFSIPQTALSKVPGYEKFKSMISLYSSSSSPPPFSDETLIGCIEVDVEGDDKHKRLVVFQKECFIDVTNFKSQYQLTMRL